MTTGSAKTSGTLTSGNAMDGGEDLLQLVVPSSDIDIEMIGSKR